MRLKRSRRNWVPLDQKKIYLIGTFKNERIEALAAKLRKLNFNVFDDWRSAHPDSDQVLWAYYKRRGFSYKQALTSLGARVGFDFDMKHLKECDAGVLVMDAGRSAHLEAGLLAGWGKPIYMLLDKSPERLDLMTAMLTDIFDTEYDLIEALEKL